MRLLTPLLGIVFYGFLLHGWWRHGRVPTVLWFEADREKHPGTYWSFLAIAATAWAWLVGYVGLALIQPERAPRFYRADPLTKPEWVFVATLAGGITFFGVMAFRDWQRRRLAEAIRRTADDLSPDEEGWGIEAAVALYKLTELHQLRDELLRAPKGYRRLADAMKCVERDWPK